MGYLTVFIIQIVQYQNLLILQYFYFYFYRRKQMYTQFGLFIMLIIIVDNNLLCKGDFQDYQHIIPNDNYLYYQASKTQCWYNLIQEQIIQFKIIPEKNTTIGADLSGDNPYVLCQTFQTITNRNHQINFDLYSNDNYPLQITASINGVNIGSLQINSIDEFYSKTIYFKTDQTQNELCFNQTLYIGSGYHGGFIDNVTAQISEMIEIDFSAELLYNNQIITLKSQIDFDKSVADELKQQYGIQIDGDVMENWDVVKTAQNKIGVQIFVTKYKYPKLIKFKLLDTHNISKMIQFNISVGQIILPIYLAIASTIFNIVAIIKGSFCSYLILSLFGFWNISLLYIFLMIPLVPETTKIIYHQLYKLFVVETDFLVWLSKYIQQTKQILIFQNILGMTQGMVQQKSGQKWFGSFELSTDIIVNNFGNFFILFLLVLKIVLIKLLNKYIIKRYLKITVITKITSWNIFASQVTAITPFIIISGVSQLQIGSINKFEQFHTGSHILLMLGSILLMMMHIFLEYKKNFLDENQGQKKQKILLIDFGSQALDKILLLTTPLLIVAEYRLSMLIVNSLIIILKLYIFIKRIKKHKMLAKITGALIHIVWFLHHFSFCILYSLAYFIQSAQQTFLASFIDTLGVIMIITVFSGGVIEAFKSLIQIISFICLIIKTICIRSHSIRPSMKNQNEEQIVPDKSFTYPQKVEQIQSDNLPQYFKEKQHVINNKKQRHSENKRSKNVKQQRANIFAPKFQQISSDRVKDGSIFEEIKEEQKNNPDCIIGLATIRYNY